MQNVELLGPNNHGLWEGCDGALLTPLYHMTQYHYADLIKTSVQRYGEGVWHIIYQAEHRMRLENMEQRRRGGLQGQASATQFGGHHTSFDSARPWGWVRREAIKDALFWRRELEEPGLLILSKITST